MSDQRGVERLEGAVHAPIPPGRRVDDWPKGRAHDRAVNGGLTLHEGASWPDSYLQHGRSPIRMRLRDAESHAHTRSNRPRRACDYHAIMRDELSKGS